MTSGYAITGIAAAAWLATALVTMVAAVGVAVLRNIVHAAFALLVVLLGVAGLYALAGADLIAVLQILLYVGGVVVLLLFAVMLTSRMGDPEVASQPLAPLRAALAVTSLSALLAYGLIVSTRFKAGVRGSSRACSNGNGTRRVNRPVPCLNRRSRIASTRALRAPRFWTGRRR